LQRQKIIISAKNNLIEREISQYEYRYKLFINSVYKYENQCNNNAYTGTLVGAAVFGSLGAVIGNIAGGAIAKKSAQEDLSEKGLKLSSHFLETLRKINSFLAQMESNTFQLITGYAGSIEESLYGNKYLR
jgi:hypothetical protein